MQFRIGDRDPVTGLFDVIWPDGSSTRNGLKAFNSAHQTGDVVLVTRRSDGMLILDSTKAVESIQNQLIVTSNPQEPPVGYLQGQVFNREEEKKKKKGIAFITTYTAYDLARQANLLPEAIAANDPGVQTLDFVADDVLALAIVYPRPEVSTTVVLQTSSNMLPIQKLPSIGNSTDYWSFGSGIPDTRVVIGLASSDPYNTAESGNRFEVNNIVTPSANPFLQWGNYDLIYCIFSTNIPNTNPFSGEAISFTLVSITDTTIANSTININIL